MQSATLCVVRDRLGSAQVPGARQAVAEAAERPRMRPWGRWERAAKNAQYQKAAGFDRRAFASVVSGAWATPTRSDRVEKGERPSPHHEEFASIGWNDQSRTIRPVYSFL